MRLLRSFAIVILGILTIATLAEWIASYRRGTILEYHKPMVYFACTYTGKGIVGLQIQTHLAQLSPPGLGNKPGWNYAPTAPDAGIVEWYDSLAGPFGLPIYIGFSPFGGSGFQLGVRCWFLFLLFGVPLAWLSRRAIRRRRQRGFEVEPTSPQPVLPPS